MIKSIRRYSSGLVLVDIFPLGIKNGSLITVRRDRSPYGGQGFGKSEINWSSIGGHPASVAKKMAEGLTEAVRIAKDLDNNTWEFSVKGVSKAGRPYDMDWYAKSEADIRAYLRKTVSPSYERTISITKVKKI